MPHVSKFSDESKQHAISDYIAGKPVEEILKQHAISMAALRWLLKRKNIPKRQPGNQKHIRHAVEEQYAGMQHAASKAPTTSPLSAEPKQHVTPPFPRRVVVTPPPPPVPETPPQMTQDQYEALTPEEREAKCRKGKPFRGGIKWTWEQTQIDKYGYAGAALVAEKSEEELRRTHPHA